MKTRALWDAANDRSGGVPSTIRIFCRTLDHNVSCAGADEYAELHERDPSVPVQIITDRSPVGDEAGVGDSELG
jgi:hypothetical protein